MAKLAPLFYVFHGNDEFTIAETLSDFKRRLGPPETVELNTTVLNGRTLTLGELRHACDTIPFLAEKRLIIVENLLTQLSPQRDQPLSRSQEELLSGLLDYLPKLPETARLVFVEGKPISEQGKAGQRKPKDDHPVLKLAQESERGFAKQFDIPDPKALPQWIEQRVRIHGGTIEHRAAEELADRLANDLLRYLDSDYIRTITGRLEQEIVKLITYTKAEHPIRVEDVEAMSSYVHPAIIFELTDALSVRDGRKASWALHRLLELDRDPLELLATIVGHFRSLIQVKELKASGSSAQDVASALKMHWFRASKLYSQVTYFTAAQLESVFRHLLDTDVAIKTGKIEPELALDLLVTGLAAPEG